MKPLAAIILAAVPKQGGGVGVLKSTMEEWSSDEQGLEEVIRWWASNPVWPLAMCFLQLGGLDGMVHQVV